ncbi:HEPN domain-containing protein [Nocardia sp. AB354]|uniref:HEPN domain-containing protein n=1 Tax=Nocardia sp. AB354 TaxID=3413283 RepID=UPI003C190126
MSESDQSGLSAAALIDQMYTLWIAPHIETSNLDITRDHVLKALVVLHPNSAPEVMLNEQAELLAMVRVRDAVASGEPVTAENIEHVSNLRPAEIAPDAGWIAFAFLPGGAVMVAFDFRYNRNRTVELLKRASEFIATAREALAAERLGPAVETALAAGELAVTAMTSLQNIPHKGRNTHGARQAWLNRYTHAGNGSQAWYKAMRRLLDARPIARYGDPEGSPLPSESELADYLDHVDDLIEHAATYAADRDAPDL